MTTPTTGCEAQAGVKCTCPGGESFNFAFVNKTSYFCVVKAGKSMKDNSISFYDRLVVSGDIIPDQIDGME